MVHVYLLTCYPLLSVCVRHTHTHAPNIYDIDFLLYILRICLDVQLTCLSYFYGNLIRVVLSLNLKWDGITSNELSESVLLEAAFFRGVSDNFSEKNSLPASHLQNDKIQGKSKGSDMQPVPCCSIPSSSTQPPRQQQKVWSCFPWFKLQIICAICIVCVLWHVVWCLGMMSIKPTLCWTMTFKMSLIYFVIYFWIIFIYFFFITHALTLHWTSCFILTFLS